MDILTADIDSEFASLGWISGLTVVWRGEARSRLRGPRSAWSELRGILRDDWHLCDTFDREEIERVLKSLPL